MQNTRTNELIARDTLEELRETIPKEDRGPVFRVGEVYPIQGYGYKLVRIKRNGLVFKPHGPIK